MRRKISSSDKIVSALILGFVLALIVQHTKIAPMFSHAHTQDVPFKITDFYQIKTFHPAYLTLDEFEEDFTIKIIPKAPKARPNREDFAQELAFNILNKTPNLIPVKGHISSSFGLRSDPFSQKLKRHYGIDIVAARGSPVFAPADGYVFTARNNRSFGNMIEIMHECGLHTRFGHLDKILVNKGDRVIRGQIIGRVGNTGSRSRGAHLHYEVRNQNVALDPMKYLKSDA